MREVWRLATIAARSDSSVVVRGETGVGKEMVARALHRLSPRKDGPFVAVNCAALSETLLESEMFGHEKGAFTGAAVQHKGRFELAHGGTLFLDEIGDLPLGLQVKLLRVLQERNFERVGGSHSIAVDVRVIAATHHDLPEAVARGRFRADLFYRLNVLSIQVPPLRERKADILALWQHLLAEAAAREGRAMPATSSSVERILLRHPWPGNVRELHNAALHAITVTSGERILPADLPDYLGARTSVSPPLGLVGLRLEEIERLAILETYETVGTIQRTAEMLGISPRKIHYRLKEYKCDGWRPPQRARHEPVSEKMRVLLAEDDDELRHALADVLRREGYEVVAVAHGRALLEQLGASLLLERRDAPADIIISDVRMPGLSGMQLLESVRGRGWRTPVVLISGVADDDTHRRAKALGAELLDKPIDVARLLSTIDGAVAH